MTAKTTPERFWKKVQKSAADSCWEWIGYRHVQGYGRTCFDGKIWLAHRLAYYFTHGRIPRGLDVRHSCDNPPCCNPSHLSLGTHQDNMIDKQTRDRCARGTKFPQSRFSDSDIRKMRSLHKSGLRCVDIARTYKTDRGNMSRILTGKLWSHLK